ncbi:rho GTPase-activating protein 19-like isoform X1 [Apostichopus japonicus]|uniref:rho GTPase-activating protein 19-like isoform X1 n=1 Tax=Stichopus japonicus TaxID=307972 RepID=UPI003AB5B3D7
MSSENLCNPLLYMEIMKRKYPETFAEWCCTELSHVLDFSGAENIGQVLLGNVDVRHGKMITRKFSRKKKHTPDSPTGIFGSPLNDAGFCYARQLIEHLKKAINHEGLFRIPGNSGRQQKLKNRINSREVIDLDSDEFTTNDIACVLKTFLGDLPEPLLTDRQYHAHVEAAGLTLGLDNVPNMSPRERTKLKVLRKSNHIKALKYLSFLLPPLNFKLFKELLELLKSIADNDEMNKMSAFNLGVIFAPHVLWPRYLTTEDLRDQSFVKKLNYAVEFMISHYNQLFIAPSSLLNRCETFIKMGGLVPDESRDNRSNKAPLRPADKSDSSRVSCPQQSTVQVKGQKDHTQAALAQLYSNVQAMPEGPKKRRLMKQFAENSFLPGTPTNVQDDLARQSNLRPRRQRSKSVGESILKQVSTPFHHKKRRLAPPPPEDNGVARQKFQMEKKLCRELVIQLSRPPRPKSRKPSDQENRPSPYTDQSDMKGCSVVLNQVNNMECSSPAVNIIASTSQDSNNNNKGKNYGKRPVPLPRSTSSPLSSSSMSNVVHPVPIPRKMPLMEGTPPSPIPRTRRAWSQHATSLQGLNQQTDV